MFLISRQLTVDSLWHRLDYFHPIHVMPSYVLARVSTAITTNIEPIAYHSSGFGNRLTFSCRKVHTVDILM